MGTLKKVAAYLGCVFLFPVLILLPPFIGLCASDLFARFEEQGAESAREVGVFAVLLGALLILLLLHAFLAKLCARLYLPLSSKRLPQRWGRAPIYHLYGSLWRQFLRGGEVSFGKRQMRLSGSTTLDMRAYLRFVLAVYAIALPLAFAGLPKTWLGGIIFAGLFIYEVALLLWIERRASVQLLPESLSHVRVSGPIMSLRFDGSDLSGLDRATFFVHPEVRLDFFAGFNATFPGRLPEEYQRAAAITPASEASERVNGFGGVCRQRGTCNS